jgi:tripartite ATP-independent transporter DctM subunit
MNSVLNVPALAPLPVGETTAPRVVLQLARWLDQYSRGLVRFALFGAVAAALVTFLTVLVDVFSLFVLGVSLRGAEQISSFAFLWAVWLGVSIAVRQGAVTVISVVSARGPAWWQRSVQTFSGLALGLLLAYAVVQSTRYAIGEESLRSFSADLSIRKVYPIASMTVGYYLIAAHYLAYLANGLARLLDGGRQSLRVSVQALVGALTIAALTWGTCAALFAAGAAKLLVLGVIFVILTLAGTPVVFMLSIVGILSTKAFLGLSFYPNPDQIFPFRQTQNAMGLKGASELIVILMFLIVAEVLNESGMSDRLIRFAVSIVGHFRGGTAYVCQVTSMLASGVSGSAQADAAIMTPLLVPAMEKDGYPRDVAAAVVSGASIKGAIGPLSIMFILYPAYVQDDNASPPAGQLLFSGVGAVLLLFVLQAATIYWVVRRRGFFVKRPFAGASAVARATGSALPILSIPVIILGGILSGVFTAPQAASVALLVTFLLAFFWYSTLTFRDIPRVVGMACVETGVVTLLLGDSAILAGTLQNNGFGADFSSFLTGITDNKYVFLLVINVLLLLVGIFIEPLPALAILAPFIAPIAVLAYGIDPVHIGLIMVFNLVLALIHPPIGLVLFLVSRIAKVPIERLSITVLPWLAVSILVLFLITYLPAGVVLWLSHLLQ